jgi:hypothetical protein
VTDSRSTRKRAALADEGDEPFRLVSIDPTPAPAGSAGRDWLKYRIAQGPNMITGYRQGSRIEVTADVERIVVALNERRGRQGGRELRPGRRPAAAAAAPAAAPEGEGSSEA